LGIFFLKKLHHRVIEFISVVESRLRAFGGKPLLVLPFLHSLIAHAVRGLPVLIGRVCSSVCGILNVHIQIVLHIFKAVLKFFSDKYFLVFVHRSGIYNVEFRIENSLREAANMFYILQKVGKIPRQVIHHHHKWLDIEEDLF
jgi:hypothetical protein